jgi:hypothetical protein
MAAYDEIRTDGAEELWTPVIFRAAKTTFMFDNIEGGGLQ